VPECVRSFNAAPAMSVTVADDSRTESTSMCSSVKFFVAFGLVCFMISSGLLYKVSQSRNGGFKFSTASALAISEIVKFLMSACFQMIEVSRQKCAVGGKARSAVASATSGPPWHATAHILALACLYALNNQLTFYLYVVADPGTIQSFKVAGTLVVAATQCLCVGKRFSWEQWRAMIITAIGVLIVQYNPKTTSARYAPKVYGLLVFSSLLTAWSAVRNEYVVKNFAVGLNVQNMILYSGGASLNVFAFFCLPNPNSADASIGFLEGYDALACGIVCVNAWVGLVMTAVYKYADAVIKCLACDFSAVLMVIISSIFFGLTPSLSLWCGVVIVCYAIYAYSSAPAAYESAW